MASVKLRYRSRKNPRRISGDAALRRCDYWLSQPRSVGWERAHLEFSVWEVSPRGTLRMFNRQTNSSHIFEKRVNTYALRITVRAPEAYEISVTCTHFAPICMFCVSFPVTLSDHPCRFM